MRRIPMSMGDWIKKLDGFLTLNDRDILTHAGNISHDMAKQLAEQEYDKFHQQRLQEDSTESNHYLEQLSKVTERLAKPDKAENTAKVSKKI